VTNASLLRDWDLLQRSVVPPLLKKQKQVRVWSPGGPADAAAIAIAFAHAQGSPEIRVFAPPADKAHRGPVGFRYADLAAVPPDDRSVWLEHRDRRWSPVRSIAERIIIGEPSGPVDLVAWRGPADDLGVADSILARLRGGGLLLSADRPFRHVCGLEPAGDDRRLMRKCGDGHDVDTTDDQEEGETLAAAEDHARLVEEHLGLASALASRFAHRGQSREELEAVAYVALVSAAGRFRPERGAFAAYATVSILGELKRHFRDRTWAVRVPRSVQERHLAINAARDELAQELGSSPTVAEVADRLGLGEDDVLEVMDAGRAYRAESLDAPVPGAEQRTIEVAVRDLALEATVERERLREVLPTLERRDQLILKRLYFDGWTQQQTADELGVSQMQVSRLLARTLAGLRTEMLDGAAR